MTEQTIPIVLIGKTTEVGSTVTEALKPEYEGLFSAKTTSRQPCHSILTSPSHPLPRLRRSSHQRTTPTLDWQETREPIIWELGNARLH
jgi:hypothetical protein